MKAIAEDNLKVAKVMISVLDRTENIVGKGETNIFSFSHDVFKRIFLNVVKSWDCVVSG